ncbi:MAG TPA: S41 family peptidase [Longimicrobiales bacterium]|nr:S41 family peptidase [Longimicrobiales bacterium]
MKLRRSIVAPIAIAFVVLTTGSWMLQQGDARANVYLQARLLQEVIYHVREHFVDEVEPDSLYRMAIDGFLRELGDPYADFLTQDNLREMTIRFSGEYAGVGIQIGLQDNWVTVISPLPGTPGQRAGIRAGDRIIEIDGESTYGLSLDQAAARMRGPKGVPVDLLISRMGVDEPIPFRIIRDEIHIRSVPAAYMVTEDIGYVDLVLFSESTTEEVADAIARLRAEGMRALILDLRRNPGGILEESVKLADLFLDAGALVVETRSRVPGESRKYFARTPEKLDGLPVVVLVGPYTASAAEIVAGALQDHDRALVLGQTTFGKGLAQLVFPLSGGNALKLTIARWYTPSGRTIERPLRSGSIARSGGGPDDVASGDDAPTFRSAGGRPLHGGGGIRPDIVLDTRRPATPDEIELDRAIQRYGSRFGEAVFQFAVQYVHDHPGLKPGFPVDSALADAFYRALVARGIELDRALYDRANGALLDYVAFEITRAAWGEEEGLKRANQDDDQIRAAVELLSKARTMEALFRIAEEQAAGADRN